MAGNSLSAPLRDLLWQQSSDVSGAVSVRWGCGAALSALISWVPSLAPPGIDPKSIDELGLYWEGVRNLYSPFESGGLKASSSEVYQHEMPGGQYTNLKFQALSLGLGDQWDKVRSCCAPRQLLINATAPESVPSGSWTAPWAHLWLL